MYGMDQGTLHPCNPLVMATGLGEIETLNPLLLLGVVAICWSIWLSRNDIVSEKKIIVLLCPKPSTTTSLSSKCS